MSKKYVRVTPYNKATGALCVRYTIGGGRFVAGKWYEVDSRKAATLASLKQGSGAPVFDVMDEATFRVTSQRELSAAMAAAGMGGLATLGGEQAPPEATPMKEGPQESKFKGMETSKEVDLSGSSAEADGSPNFDAMGRDELDELAAEQELDLPDGASDDDVRGILRENA